MIRTIIGHWFREHKNHSLPALPSIHCRIGTQFLNFSSCQRISSVQFFMFISSPKRTKLCQTVQKAPIFNTFTGTSAGSFLSLCISTHTQTHCECVLCFTSAPVIPTFPLQSSHCLLYSAAIPHKDKAPLVYINHPRFFITSLLSFITVCINNTKKKLSSMKDETWVFGSLNY